MTNPNETLQKEEIKEPIYPVKDETVSIEPTDPTDPRGECRTLKGTTLGLTIRVAMPC